MGSYKEKAAAETVLVVLSTSGCSQFGLVTAVAASVTPCGGSLLQPAVPET
jgi:hypothetical protein